MTLHRRIEILFKKKKFLNIVTGSELSEEKREEKHVVLILFNDFTRMNLSYYFTPSRVFTLALSDGFSLKFE